MVDYSHYQCLKIEKAGKLATVTLNRGETRNQIDRQFHHELQDIWRDLAEDEISAKEPSVVHDQDPRYYSIRGDYLILQYSRIVTLNLDYFWLSEASPNEVVPA